MNNPKTANFIASSTSNRILDPKKVLDSKLFDLMYSSNVNDIDSLQVSLAQKVIKTREELTFSGLSSRKEWGDIYSLQKKIIERHLSSREIFFGREQLTILDDIESLAKERRDTFIVIKFMDESPHILATIKSLLNQDFDMKRLVIVAVDNNSTDGSDVIVKSEFSRNKNSARLYYLNQPMAGGGNAARFGVDCCISTIYKMCKIDGDWSRLQNNTIAVTDGDTVYTEGVLNSIDEELKTDSNIDGVMPFLIYKITSAMRFFSNHTPLANNFENIEKKTSIMVKFSLKKTSIYNNISLKMRLNLFNSTKKLKNHCIHYDEIIPYLSLIDSSGAKAKLYEDGQLLLEEHPVTGDDRHLVYMQNNYINKDEKWKWHTLVGHDLFLRSLFTQHSFPKEIIEPDTSDALKTFRCWSFSIGGQHQLSKHGFKTVTGTDYQSGRVHKAVGCSIVLGDAAEYSETEVDRLAKMIRNFHRKQNIFYGDVRSSGLDRASGLYLHMTRIQGEIESEVSQYSDEFYHKVAFPERVLFPLRWVLKNAVVSYALSGDVERKIIEEIVLGHLVGKENTELLKIKYLPTKVIKRILYATHDERDEMGEKLAEDIIKSYYKPIMEFYVEVLRSYFSRNNINRTLYEWLLEGVNDSKCALANPTGFKNPADAWSGEEYIIDETRGQVVSLDLKKKRMSNDRSDP